jgi:hypothetical protein
MSKLHLEAKRWLKSHREVYPFLAVAAPHVAVPDTLRLASISRDTAFQCRTWAFKTADERNRFVEEVETAETAGCQ